MNKVREYLDLVDDKKALLEYLQRYMTEERSIRFQEVLKYRTRHFTVAVEDVYKERNAVLSCEQQIVLAYRMFTSSRIIMNTSYLKISQKGLRNG